MTIDEARAHQQYDDCMFCPGCSKLLTGLHGGSRCYTNWIEKKAQQILKNRRMMDIEVKVLIGVVLTSLAGAAVFYITFLIAVDEVRKDIKRKRHGRRK